MCKRAGPGSTAALFVLALLAGCASVPEQHSAALPAAPPPPRPVLPAGMPERMTVPAADGQGGYLTLNHGLTPVEAMWHVRSALNVAALGCRSASDATLTASYNLILDRQRKSLAAAYAAVQADARVRFGNGWQAQHDAQMTRLYNFFAQPFAKDGFCAAAGAVAVRAGSASPDEFQASAGTMLAELEAPFIAAYRSYDVYRRDLAAWDARYGSGPAGMEAPRLAYAPVADLLAWKAQGAPLPAERTVTAAATVSAMR